MFFPRESAIGGEGEPVTIPRMSRRRNLSRLRRTSLPVAIFACFSAVACREDPQVTTSATTGGGTGGTGGTATGGTGGDGTGAQGGGGDTTGGGGTGGSMTGGGGTGGSMTGGGGAGGSMTGGGGAGGSMTGGGGTGGAMTGGGGTGGTGGSGGAGPTGNCSPDSGPPEIVTMGMPGKLLLKGCVVTPDEAYDGEVLVESDTLTCVGPDCSASPGAATATVVATHGVILPGLVDAHNHILFDIFDETDWSPSQVYDNHNQWTAEARYGAMVDAKQYLNGEGVPNLDPGFGCEMNKYGELKGLIAGTTSILGAANPANKTCYGSLARTIDQTPNDLGQDKIQVATLFPPSSPDTICSNIETDKTDALVAHVGEGVDNTALNEFATLGTTTTPDNCLYVKETTIIHGTAFGEAQFDLMAANGMSLVWSPRSNVFLYGGGTDKTKTTNIPLALQKGINVAMGPDWSLGGSQNMLDELRFADDVDNSVWGDILSTRDLVLMATKNGAAALGLSSFLGTLEPGKKADLFVISGDPTYPWDAVLAATPADVRLVLVGGVPLYGNDELGPLGPASPGCETLMVCGEQKFVCVAEPGGTATNKFGQTLSDITSVLESELVIYDDMNLSQWDFAPIAPLVKCP